MNEEIVINHLHHKDNEGDEAMNIYHVKKSLEFPMKDSEESFMESYDLNKFFLENKVPEVCKLLGFDYAWLR